MPSDPDLRGRKHRPVAPDKNASVEEHRKHAAEVLEFEEYKKKPAGFQDKTDEAKP